MGLSPHWIGVIAVGVLFAIAAVGVIRKAYRSGGFARGAWRFDANLLALARESDMSTGLRLTPDAAKQMRKAARESRLADAYVLVRVTRGGPAGVLYHMDLRSTPAHPRPPDARTYQSLGIPIVCDKESFTLGKLNGAAIDWHSTDDGGGFWFDVPGMPRPF